MRVNGRNGRLVNVLLIALIIAGAGLVYYVIQLNAATPASITPLLSEIGVGQTAPITVSWSAQGESVPYTVYLYQSPTSSSCGPSFQLVTAKPGLPVPGFTFNVNPTATSYYCGTVAGAKGSSAVSAIVTVTVNPALAAPTLSLSSSGIDNGQTVVITASVAWSGGISPFSVTLYRGENSTCALDTTKATLASGSNPQVGLTGRSTTFSVPDPPSTEYYCASVTDGATNPHTLTSPAVPFAINGVLTASISPQNPTVDMGQSMSLTAVATYGTAPYTYQWFTGAACQSQNSISDATGSVFKTTVGSSFNYSLFVKDSSKGTPAQSVCANEVGKVNPAFVTTPVKVLPANLTADYGAPFTLTVTWTPTGPGVLPNSTTGTVPYIVYLTQSNSTDCHSPIPYIVPMAGVTRPYISFTINSTASRYFCATVVDDAAVPQNTSSTFASTVVINPVLTPILRLSPSAADVGQSASVTASVVILGGTPPYSISLTRGTSASCSSDTILVSVTSGSNPLEGLAGHSASFGFKAPVSTTDYCATVTDATGQTASSVVVFTVNALLTATVSPASTTIDSGQVVVLTANPLKGTASYTYQWYTGLNCVSGGAISGKTSGVYTTPPLTSSMNYSVLVGDSSGGTPAYAVCVNAAVTVNPALGAPVLVLSPASMDSGQSAKVTASISWSGGSPQYTVTLDSGTSVKCSSDTTVVSVSPASNPQTGLTARSTTFSFSAPTASLYYCAIVKDGAATPVSATSSATEFTVSTTLGTPSLVISPKAKDVGQTVTVSATVTWSGGSSPFTVTLYSGSSATCSSDTLVVAPLSGTDPQTGLTGTSTSFAFTAPGSTTYYCATLTDSAGTPVTLSTSTASFAVNPPLSNVLLVLSPGVLDSGQSATVTAKVTWSGGTSPFTVTLYSGSSATCSSDTTMVGVLSASNPQTGLTGTPASFTLTSPGLSTYYCATVQESSPIPVTLSSSTRPFTVNPALAATISPALPSTQSGKPITLTALPSQGTSPYLYQWYTGSTCTSGSAIPSATSSSYTASPTSTTQYSVKVTDSSTGTPAASVCVTVTVNTGLANTISPSAPSIDSGQPITLTALPSQGTSPYLYQWYTGPTCSVMISGATNSSYATSPMSTTQYSVMVTDSHTPTPAAVCSSATVTVNSVFTGTSVTVSSPTVLDTGQAVALIVSWPSAGTPPYAVQLTTSLSTSCSSPEAFESQTGIGGTSVTFTISPTSSAYYCATVTDSAYSSESSSTTVAVVVSVNPALSTPTLVLSPSAIDKGQTATVTATVMWSGGTSPYTVTLYSGSSSSCASDTTKVVVSGSNPESGLTGTSSTFSFASPASTTYYCAVLMDSATAPVSETSSSSVLTVNAALTAATSPASLTIDTGQSVVLTAVPSGGTPTYSYQWYSGSTCTGTIPGQTSQSYPTGALLSTRSFSVLVTDSSPGIPGASYCASVTVSVSAAIGATITPASPKIDSGQFVTLTAVPSGGAPSYLYQWYSGSGCVGGNALSGATSSSFFTGTLTTTTTFSVNVTDSSVGTPAASFCASVTVTVNPVITAGAIAPSSPKVDSGQSITLTSSPSGGTTPYTYQWYTGAGCTVAVGGATSATYAPSPTTTTTYYYKVTDSATTPSTACSTGDTVTVNPALTAPVISALPASISSGGSSTLSTTTSFSGGTSTYTCQWLEEVPGATSYVSLGSSFACTTSSHPTVSTGTLTTVGAWKFELEVTDSSAVPSTVVSSTVTVTVT